jgi:cysteine desulfurase
MPAASVYLDHNATSPLRPEAFDAMVAALATGGNPSAVHSVGRKARGLVDKARRQVAARVGALPTEVIFTSGGTEANNMALAGAGRRRVLISSIEHESVQRAVPEADIVPVDGEGVLDLAALERKLAASGEPALVSVMFANNETGVLQPMADVVRIARKAGALVHCDAVQAAGKVPVDLHGIGIDYLSLAAHKLGGPTGVGALIVRADAPFVPNRFGGGQETNRRAGTENLSGIVGFGAAAAAAGGLDSTLRDRGEAALLAIAPGARSCRCLRQRGLGLLVGQGAPFGGAGGHGHRRCRGGLGGQNKLRLELAIRRYRSLDCGLAGPICPSREVGYCQCPSGLVISRG